MRHSLAIAISHFRDFFLKSGDAPGNRNGGARHTLRNSLTKSVNFFQPAISLDQVKLISSRSKALSDLINYTLTHTLCLNDQEITELKVLLGSKWPSFKEDMSDSSIKNSNTDLATEWSACTSPALETERAFIPSKGIEPIFGARISEFQDGMHYIYMFLIEGFSGGMTGISDESLANGSVN